MSSDGKSSPTLLRFCFLGIFRHPRISGRSLLGLDAVENCFDDFGLHDDRDPLHLTSAPGALHLVNAKYEEKSLPTNTLNVSLNAESFSPSSQAFFLFSLAVRAVLWKPKSHS